MLSHLAEWVSGWKSNRFPWVSMIWFLVSDRSPFVFSFVSMEGVVVGNIGRIRGVRVYVCVCVWRILSFF